MKRKGSNRKKFEEGSMAVYVQREGSEGGEAKRSMARGVQ